MIKIKNVLIQSTFVYFSDHDTGNPMVAGYQADIDPDDFAPAVANIKASDIFKKFNFF